MPYVSKKKLQAMSEGQKSQLDIESLLLASRSSFSIGGVNNSYTTYESQVREAYKKYNSEAEWGNQQFKSVADIRISFIAGEGVSVAAKNQTFIKWLNNFVKKNKAFGSMFFNSVIGAELTGKCLFTLRTVPGEYPQIVRVPYSPDQPYEVVLSDFWDPSSVVDVVIKKGGKTESLGLPNFIYIRTGGDDIDINRTTAKCGAILNDAENYDRAVKDIRRLNHVLARITPIFQTKDEAETNKLANFLKKWKWKIGQTFVGTAKMTYETVGTGAHQNLKDELSTTIKNIASVTGVPVHWVGWTDLMSNRSTADSLYDTIGTATVRERTLFSEGIYDLIVKAQELYIDSGGTDINKVYTDFEVKIPVIDFSKFLETVRALSIAYNDDVISRSDYQNMIPGIDPLATEKALKAEQKEEEKKLVKMADLTGSGKQNNQNIPEEE